MHGCVLNCMSQNVLTRLLLALRCSSATFENAEWPETSAGSAAAGVCHTGYAGGPSRECSLDGQWGPVANGCIRTPQLRLLCCCSQSAQVFRAPPLRTATRSGRSRRRSRRPSLEPATPAILARPRASAITTASGAPSPMRALVRAYMILIVKLTQAHSALLSRQHVQRCDVERDARRQRRVGRMP